VHRGEVWVSNDQIEVLLELVMRLRPLQIAKPGGMALLTRREQDIVRLVAERMRNEEISQKFDITEHTIRNYLTHIFDKLGMSSRVELVLYTLSANVIPRRGANGDAIAMMKEYRRLAVVVMPLEMMSVATQEAKP
jgi:DNA-binding CsgD family transcriptional regulator